MSYLQRLLACAAFSFSVHFLAARGAALLPEQEARPRPQKIRVRVVEPPLSPPPEPEPPPPPPPRPVEVPLPAPVVVHKPRVPVRPAETPPPPAPVAPPPPAAGPTGGRPRFGVSMESTSQAGTGPALPTGDGAARAPSGPARPGTGGEDAPPGPGAPAEAYEVSKMPLPRGRCTGAYTEAARQAAVEGTVLLDLVVGADGRARDIKIVHGLGHGLDEAAVAALRSCRFTPGERAGAAVPVRVREFKIRFFLQED